MGIYSLSDGYRRQVKSLFEKEVFWCFRAGYRVFGVAAHVQITLLNCEPLSCHSVQGFGGDTQYCLCRITMESLRYEKKNDPSSGLGYKEDKPLQPNSLFVSVQLCDPQKPSSEKPENCGRNDDRSNNRRNSGVIR